MGYIVNNTILKKWNRLSLVFCAIYITYEKVLQMNSLILIHYCDMLYFNSKIEVETTPIMDNFDSSFSTSTLKAYF